MSLIENESLRRDRHDPLSSSRGPTEGGCGSEYQPVGTGPGGRKNLTGEADALLEASDKILGAQRYLDLIGSFPGEKVSHSGPCPERSYARFQEADKLARIGKKSSILTGGDPSIFSASWRIMDLAKNNTAVHLSPGVSAAHLWRGGEHLSQATLLFIRPDDPATPSLLAASGFGVVIYNVKA